MELAVQEQTDARQGAGTVVKSPSAPTPANQNGHFVHGRILIDGTRIRVDLPPEPDDDNDDDDEPFCYQRTARDEGIEE